MKFQLSLLAATLSVLVLATASAPALAQSRECTDAPTLFSDDGYRGRSLPVTDSIPDLHRQGMGDDASSICVPYGWRVVVYEDDNFRGDFLELRGQTAISDLKRDRPNGQNWGDRISSIKVFRPAPTQRGRHIDCNRPTLYSNDGFGGRTVTLQESEPNLHRLRMGDDASSLCVPAGWSVVFYEDTDYRGDSLNVKGPTSIADLKRDRPDGRNWGDRISSARVVAPYRSGRPRNDPYPDRGAGRVECSQYPVLYEHDDFRGRTLNLNRSISDLHGQYWGNQASSICVPRGWRVVLYEDPNYRGESVTIEGPRNVSLHGGFGGLGFWGDRVSSAEAFPPGRWRSGVESPYDDVRRAPSECNRGPALFWDGEFRGRSLLLDVSQPDLHRLGFGDEASSICVPRGWRVILYEDTNYRGRALEINGWGTIANLAVDAPDGYNWNDRVSSVRVERPWQR